MGAILFKSETATPNVLHRTKARMEQSRVEKIRRNNAFLLTPLTLHRVLLFTMARQNHLQIIIILLRLIFSFFFRGQYDRSLKQKLWKHSSDSWRKTCGWICDLEFTSYFSSFIYFFIHRNTWGTVKEKRLRKISVSSEAQVPYAWHPLKKNQMKKTNEF